MQKLDKSKLVMNLAKKDKLIPYLDKVFAEGFDDPWPFVYEPKLPDDAWHPSGDCTPSAIDLYEKALNYLAGKDKSKPSGTLQKSFLVGHFWHQLLQHIVLERLKFCEPEAIERFGKKAWATSRRYYGGGGDGFEFPRPFCWVAGHGDIAPIELPSGWTGIVDFKTMNSSSFNSTQVPFADKYECQMNIYMDLFELDKALIVGINKDSPHTFKEFEFARNDALIDWIYDKWIYVGGCVAARTPPDKTISEIPLKGPVQ